MDRRIALFSLHEISDERVGVTA